MKFLLAKFSHKLFGKKIYNWIQKWKCKICLCFLEMQYGLEYFPFFSTDARSKSHRKQISWETMKHCFFSESQKRFVFLRHQTNALEGLSTIFQTSGESFFFLRDEAFFFWNMQKILENQQKKSKKVVIFNLRKFFVTLYFASSKFCFHTNVSLCKVFRTYENNFL